MVVHYTFLATVQSLREGYIQAMAGDPSDDRESRDLLVVLE